MNLMELLQLVDARLRPLATADESTLQAILEEVAAGPRPVGVAPNVAPPAILAGQLVSIEQECRMLRDQLHVQLTPAASFEVQNISVGSVPPGPAPTDPNEPEKAD